MSFKTKSIRRPSHLKRVNFWKEKFWKGFRGSYGFHREREVELCGEPVFLCMKTNIGITNPHKSPLQALYFRKNHRAKTLESDLPQNLLVVLNKSFWYLVPPGFTSNSPRKTFSNYFTNIWTLIFTLRSRNTCGFITAYNIWRGFPFLLGNFTPCKIQNSEESSLIKRKLWRKSWNR